MDTYFFVFMGFLLGWIASAVWDVFLRVLQESKEKDSVHKG